MGDAEQYGNSGQEAGLRSRFRAWLPETPSVSDAHGYYTDSTIVLDSSVLLNLYEVTAQSRGEILDALSRVADRLWLPNHVGVEFLRARRSCVDRRRKAFSEARQHVNNAFQAAASQLRAARDEVETLVRKHSFGDDAELARGLLPDDAFDRLADVVVWKEGLIGEIARIADAYDLQPEMIGSDDPVLSVIENMYADRIGPGFTDSEIARLVLEAVTFRFPNAIAPGYKDAEGGGKKPTDLLRAGDFLIWEEILREAEKSQRPVLLVTLDVKEDWWTLDRRGKPVAARPDLVNEMFRRSGMKFRMETLQSFMASVSEHFGVQLSDQVSEELERVADQNLADKEIRPAPAVASSSAPDLQPGFWQVADMLRGIVPIPDSRVLGPMVVLAGSDAEDLKSAGWVGYRLPVWQGVRDVLLAPWVADALGRMPASDANRLRVELGRALSRSLDEEDG